MNLTKSWKLMGAVFALAGLTVAWGEGQANTLTAIGNKTACAGNTVTFTTTAGGTTPYKFTWLKNGVVISNQTTNHLTLSNVTSANAGTYTVILKGGANSVTNSGTLTVAASVSATPLPNLLRYVGSIAVFSTTPSGAGPFTFTWRKNGTNISNQTGSSLTLSNVMVADSGVYSVLVSDACGNTVTESGTLTVDTCFAAVDVMLVIDRSGSMTGTPYFDALAACSNFVQNLHYTNGDQAGIASYNSSATLDQTLTNRLAKLDQSIDAIPSAGGFTSVSLGLQTGQNELVSVRHHTNSLPVLVLLSDGMPTGSDTSSNALYWAGQSKIAGTRIFTVGLGSVNASLLKGIASTTNDYYFTTNSAQLTALFNAVSTVICRPPTNIVVTGPSNLTVCAGSTANFSVTATGCDSYRYQWLKNGAVLTGRTNNVLTLNNVAATDAGVYSVAVLSDCQNVTNSATLGVNANTVIATPPANTTVCPGATANFSVNASGTGLSYQWYNAAGPLSGQTNGTLTLSGVTAAQAGIYSVVASGICGVPVTNSATLFVNANTVITTPPANTIVCPGTTANFSVNAIGTGLTYQWYKGTSLLAGKTGSILALSGVSAADAGTYSVVVSGACSVSVTNSATLSVNANTIISVPPTNATNCPGATANFSVNATGAGLTYQWYKGTSVLSGKTGSSLSLPNVSAADAGVYNVVIGGACGLPVTNSATLFVNANTVISVPPSNTTNCPGTTANFSVSASGTGLVYQWYKGTGPLSGRTNSTLSLANVSAADAGIYNVVISGACGVSLTNSATLAVNANTIVAIPPTDATVCPGTTANFSVNASGTGLSYQWYGSTGPLSTQTNSTLSLTNVSLADVGSYSVVVSGVCGLPLTNSATLFVNSNTVVLLPPADVTVCPGMTANFTVGVTGTGFTFQWYNNAGLLNGQTNSTLSLANVSAANAGVYQVVVKGVCGAPSTNSATLFVNANTIIATPPSNTTNCSGTTVNFSVNATGTGLIYQWYKSTGPISGQTNSALSLPSVSATDAGIYSVVVSGACSVPVTNSATLFVNANTIISKPPTNTTNCPGTTANFSVNATGTGLSYQWYHGAGPLSGKTNSTLSLLNVSAPADLGSYSVVVSGVCGLPVTNSATLLINSNTIVATPPKDVTVCPGMTANFTVSAIGTDFTFQWYNSAGPLSGQTSSTLSLTNVSAANAGIYRVVVSGICGVPITNSATLAVNTNALIATSLSNTTNCPGTTANFSVNAAGTGLTYQWYKGAALLAGHTTNVLTLGNVSSTDAGVYSVVVSGVCGLPVTNSATLVVNTNALIVKPMSNATNCPGTIANFSVNAVGTGLTYQWYKGAALLAGHTTNVLTLNNVIAADAGTYSVVVSGVCSATATNSATLFVNENIIVVYGASTNETVCPGATVNFFEFVTGTDLRYQWYKGTTLLAGQTTNLLTLTNVGVSDAATYNLVISGACGVPVTNRATLFVNATTIVAVPPTNTTVCPGTTANFSVNATGTGLTYQWYNATGGLAGQTGSTLSLPNVRAADAGVYTVVVSGACGAPVTLSAVLTVNQNVSVAALANVTNNIGTSVTFTALASGTGPFNYQWFKAGTALAGQTNRTLTLSNLQPGDSGMYSVSVTGACGQAAATAAVLTVNLPPVATITYPTNGTIFVEPATFTVLASASDPDGVVTNVEFFSSTNGTTFVLIGQTNNQPYLTIASNLPAGHYTFVARATDNWGATGDSAPVSVDVVPVNPPDVFTVGAITLNTQDGFQWLTNVACNPVYSHANALRIDIHNITNSAIRVMNASGTNNGVPFVISPGAIQPGTCWTNVIKFYDPLNVAFFPVLTVQLADPIGVGEPDGNPQAIFSGKFLRDGTFLVEFTTVPGITYYVQYSSDMVHWKTVFPPFAGTGQHLQWIDSGPPETESLPSIKTVRFYRVLLAN